MERDLRFGFLPKASCYTGGCLIAEPLNDFDERVSGVWKSSRVDGVWLHPPLEERKGSSGFGPVTVQTNVYTVPETHVLRAERGRLPDYEICDLVISAIGFLKGLRLIPEGWNHFYKTPVQLGFLVDFYCDDSQIGPAMAQVIAFADKHQKTKIPARMFAALHWFLVTQSYEHEFELLIAQYTVMETCWWIFNAEMSPPKKPKHSERLIFMCDHFGIPIPGWAEISGGGSFLSRLRNEMLHDGYFAGAAIGFEFPGQYPDIDIELRNLNSRLLMALLGFKASYIYSKVEREFGGRLVLE